MSDKKEMTVSEALADGYKFCHGEDGESFCKIEKLTTDDFTDRTWYLSEKTPFKFSISSKTIRSLIEDHLETQDEVYDEGIFALLDAVDFEAVAALINPAFTKNYYMATAIILKPDTETNTQ